MQFPTPWTVILHPFVEGATRNAHGKQASGFGDDIEQPVIAIYPPSAETEPHESGRNALVRDLDVLVAPDFSCDRRSEITVTDAPYAGRYTIEGGVENYGLGPFGFNPGGRLALKLVKESGDA